MLSKNFQDVIEQTESILKRPLGILNNEGDVIAYTGKIILSDLVDEIMHSFSINTKSYCHRGYTFVPISEKSKLEYVLYIEGVEPHLVDYCSILAVGLTNIKIFYDEKYDRANYIKNVLMDNILAGDMLFKAKELNIENDKPRVVYIIRSENQPDFSTFSLIQNIFPDKDKDFIINIDEYDIALVKELDSETNSNAQIEQIAKNILETLSGELLVPVNVGIGSTCTYIRDIAKSYKEAQIALEVGKVFDTEKNILSYYSLGIARLIHQLPPRLCELFLDEVFKKDTLEVLDDETIHTIQKFFEYNLNVSETSRQLYVHRNTLVYRLDKIQRLTGLDLREFDQAIVFKIAMMVSKYLHSTSMHL